MRGAAQGLDWGLLIACALLFPLLTLLVCAQIVSVKNPPPVYIEVDTRYDAEPVLDGPGFHGALEKVDDDLVDLCKMADVPPNLILSFTDEDIKLNEARDVRDDLASIPELACWVTIEGT